MAKKQFVMAITGAAFMACGTAYAIQEDHKDITGPFASPMELTATCLECHEDVAMEVMATSHWTWQKEQVIEGRKVSRGKANVINNFCIAFPSNYARCSSCHIGYGWKDANFDFSDPNRIDCLSCHDTTGTYKKPMDAPAGAGMPPGFTGKEKFDKKPYDLAALAQNAGTPSRLNCLVCHANGGGGNAIKHGDIDLSLVKPSVDLDVHMSPEGNDFSCQECHTTEEHKIKGDALVVSPGGDNPVTCLDCHDEQPHEKKALNKHTARVACQTCHIPTFARQYATKMDWDWSTAQNPKGLTDEQKKISEHGHPVYNFMKGSFVYEQDVIPEYHWYNGTGGAYTKGDRIDPTKETRLNYPIGSKNDPDSRIAPFKAHHGTQIYDKGNMILGTPKLFGSPKDPAAYWAQYDWNKAMEAGMKENGLSYSGEYGWAKTVTYWPTNHMVVPAENALKCNACHGKNGRLDWEALGYKGDPRKK